MQTVYILFLLSFCYNVNEQQKKKLDTKTF